MTTLHLRNSINRSPLRRGCLLIAFALCCFALSPAAQASSTYWRVSSSDWFTCTNWSDGCPDSSKDALINNGGKAEISNPNTMAYAQSLALGLNLGESGTVTVDGNGTTGGSLTVPQGCGSYTQDIFPGLIAVGYRGTGTLNITGGGTVASQMGYIAARTNAQLPTSNGAVTVDGARSTWTISNTCQPTAVSWLFIGGSWVNGVGEDPGGTALLSVTNGGTVIVSNHFGAAYSVTVGPSGTLTGNGTITVNGNTYESKTTVVNGTLAPSGTLTFNGNLAVTHTGTMRCNVTPSAWDMVHVVFGQANSGQADLRGRLSVTMTGTFTPSTQFTLLHADNGLGPYNNRFESVSINYPPVPTYTPVITYDTNNVYLYLMPN